MSNPSLEDSAPRTIADSTVPVTAQIPGSIRLVDFLQGVTKLSADDRIQVVAAGIAMLSGVFVHLPLKRSMYGIDPIQRLRLLKYRLEDEKNNGTSPEDDRGFHDEMIEIFHSLRDLHTNYILPIDYQGKTAFLPFLVEEYYETGGPRQQNFIVSKTRSLSHPRFKAGVKITHWNGIPIARAVELNAAREAGSNMDARHARGLESLTLRSMELTAAPDEEWVVIRFESEGQPEEIRFEWQVVEPPQLADAADLHDESASLGDATLVLGFDAETETIRRARKSIFDEEAMTRERVMAEIMDTVLEQAENLELESAEGLELNPTMTGARGFQSKGRTRLVKDPTKVIYEAAKQYRDQMSFSRSWTTSESSSRDQDAAQLEVAGVGPSSTAATEDVPSVLPDFFRARNIDTPVGKCGYIRIYSFLANDPDAFVVEFARLAQSVSANSLIIDVRKNGGGNIIAGEKVLQVLSPRAINPARFHLINTETTSELCRNANLGLGRWASSVQMSIATGETYSQGFTLTDLNSLTESFRYQGKKLLIVDALCYSTTDIFAAGFQDNNLGIVLGTSGRTGAGGANVWGYQLFQSLKGFIPVPLPGGVRFRAAVRRSTRVGDMIGVPLEDLGVRPDKRHYLTLRDVTKGNADLLEYSAKLLLQPND